MPNSIHPKSWEVWSEIQGILQLSLWIQTLLPVSCPYKVWCPFIRAAVPFFDGILSFTPTVFGCVCLAECWARADPEADHLHCPCVASKINWTSALLVHPVFSSSPAASLLHFSCLCISKQMTSLPASWIELPPASGILSVRVPCLLFFSNKTKNLYFW